MFWRHSTWQPPYLVRRLRLDQQLDCSLGLTFTTERENSELRRTPRQQNPWASFGSGEEKGSGVDSAVLGEGAIADQEKVSGTVD